MTDLIKNMPNQVLGWKIANEGFDYFFTSYIDPSSIDDPELKGAVDRYWGAKEAIEYILESHGIVIAEDYDYDDGYR